MAGRCLASRSVLLADDMGLGNTFQALAFLAWVRQNLTALGVHRSGQLHPTAPAFGPMMIVATIWNTKICHGLK